MVFENVMSADRQVVAELNPRLIHFIRDYTWLVHRKAWATAWQVKRWLGG